MHIVTCMRIFWYNLKELTDALSTSNNPKVWTPTMYDKMIFKKTPLFSDVNYVSTMLFFKESYFEYQIVEYEVMKKHPLQKKDK